MKPQRFFEQVPIGALPTSVLAGASMTPPAALRTALVVDDDRKIADTLSRILHTHGYIVETAYSGEQGLQLARILRPGLIVSDVGMPKMDGITLVDTIARFLPASRIVLICEQLPRNQNLLPWPVLKKPVDGTALLALLADIEEN